MLRKTKPKDRRGKIVLINASREFKKGTPKNYLTDEAIGKIAAALANGEPVDEFSAVITNEKAAENDFNLSPSRYVASTNGAQIRELSAVIASFESVLREEANISKEVEAICVRLMAIKNESN